MSNFKLNCAQCREVIIVDNKHDYKCPICSYENKTPYHKREYQKLEISTIKLKQGVKPDFSNVVIDFGNIIGYNEIKEIIQDAVRSSKAIHILLHGPSGCGKTELINAVEKTLPNYFTMVSNSGTKAGIAEQLKSKKPFILGIDELEKWKKTDLESLFMLMSNGRFIKVTKTEHIDIELECSVFATCNDLLKLKRLVEPMVDRFIVLSMDDLTEEQFIDIGIPMLMNKYKYSEEFSAKIVTAVMEKLNRKLRTLNKIASLVKANPTEDNLKRKIEILYMYKSKM